MAARRVVGLVVALALAGLLLLSSPRRESAWDVQGVRQAYVVTVTQDIPEFTPIRPDAVAIKGFPAAFAPVGAATRLEEVVGKVSTTRLVRDQIVIYSSVSPGAPARVG